SADGTGFVRASRIVGQSSQTVPRCSYTRRRQSCAGPEVHWIRLATVRTLGLFVVCPAVGTACSALKRVKRFPTVPALPKGSKRRSGTTVGTLIPAPAWQFGELHQPARVLQSTPAIHQHENGKGGVPDRVTPYRQRDEPSHSHEAQTSGDHQTSPS